MANSEQDSFPQVLAAGAVVFRDQPAGPEYLLLRNSLHQTWAPPKGHLEPGESCEEGAKRELLEEIGSGAVLDFIPGFAVENSYLVEENGQRCSKVVTYYLARLTGGEVCRSEEHDALLWAGLDRALATLRFPDLRRVIEQAHLFLRGD